MNLVTLTKDGRTAKVEPGDQEAKFRADGWTDAAVAAEPTPEPDPEPTPEPAAEATQPDPTGEGTPTEESKEPKGNTFVRDSVRRGGRRKEK
jgi:hypothetical protein